MTISDLNESEIYIFIDCNGVDFWTTPSIFEMLYGNLEIQDSSPLGRQIFIDADLFQQRWR